MGYVQMFVGGVNIREAQIFIIKQKQLHRVWGGRGGVVPQLGGGVFTP